MPPFVNGLGKTSFIPMVRSKMVEGNRGVELTISKVHINVVGSYVRCHGNDWNSWPYFSNANSGGYTIEVRHNNIHKNKVKLIGAVIDLVHGFKTIPLLTIIR
jgi:hypothetical protein